mmetsp:Transcript_5271/g.10467  ORF Transcript_5271/g.10467 Transcript_5271/m.10467 type:complete len:219 (-) Transcript_5271:107-763(-)
MGFGEGETLWRYLFVYFEGVGINILLQLWIMADPDGFLRTYVPYYAEKDLVSIGDHGAAAAGGGGGVLVTHHPVVVLLTRSWAYMIIVLGVLEVSLLTHGSAPAHACFHAAALLGDVLHIGVFGRFIASGHGPLDAGAMIGLALASALALARCCRLAVLRRRITAGEPVGGAGAGQCRSPHVASGAGGRRSRRGVGSRTAVHVAPPAGGGATGHAKSS